MAEASKIRLVRCPKCGNVLPELPGYSVYACGGCDAVLIGKRVSGFYHYCLYILIFFAWLRNRRGIEENLLYFLKLSLRRFVLFCFDRSLQFVVKFCFCLLFFLWFLTKQTSQLGYCVSLR